MSEDLIKRSDAIETAYQLRHKPNDAEWTEWLKSFNAIPSAEPKTGKWVDCRRGCNYYANCSNCGMQIDVREKGGYPNFCENCGADMRGGEDE